MKKSRILIASVLLALGANASALSVLVAHPISAGIAEDLLKDTGSEILYAVPKNLPATRQAHHMENRGKEELAELAKKADAVVTVQSVFPQEHLYPYARRANIRVVPIDIAMPLDGDGTGVAVGSEPLEQHQVWLNPNNLQAMYELFAVEASAMEPSIKAKIESNLENKIRTIRDLLLDSNEFMSSLDEEAAMLVMDPELEYLSQGLEMHAVVSEIPEDAEGREELAKLFKRFNVRVAVNGKNISDEEKAFLEDKGVKFVKISRLKAEDPVAQLKALYEDLKAALSS